MPAPGLDPLPIDGALDEIVAALRASRRLVVTAAPGSGKTTRIPPALVDGGVDGEVVVLEPRRIAARAAARRVAAERGGAVGDEVGYQVRDDVRVSARTRIRFVTEGVLVRRLCTDPFLDGVGAVVLDEFHERHVETDLALSMLAEVAATVREDLAILVTSATLDPAPLQRFLGGCAHLECGGRPHAVEVEHVDDAAGARPGLSPQALAELVARGVRRALEATAAGDVLVFLPGVAEIQAAAAALADTADRRGLAVLPLHGALPPAEQDRALRADPGRRRVVLATNVAESSLTIDGVRAVVDTGLARVLHHDPARGIDALRVERISRASAEQRAGRAGRLGPGYCLRLWARAEERGMPATDVPELRRADLAGPALSVRAFAGRDPAGFGWFEPPEAAALARAEELLSHLDAVDGSGRVTGIGRAMLALPLHPRLARVLVEGQHLGVRAATAAVCALLAERDPLLAEARGSAPIDLLDRLDRLEAARAARFDAARCRGLGLHAGAARAVDQACRRLARPGGFRIGDAEHDAVARAVLAGFPDRVAQRTGPQADEARMVGGRGLRWEPGALHDHAPLLIALDVADTGARRSGSRSQVRLALGLERRLLEAVAGDRLRTEVRAELDGAGSVVGVRRTCYLDLALDEVRGGVAPPDAVVAELLANELRRDPAGWLAEQGELAAFLARLRWLRRATGDAALPELGDDELARIAAAECTPARSVRALRGRSLLPAVRAALPPAVVARVERDAPERVPIASGRHAKLDYALGDEPVLAVRMQELFGTTSTPRVLGGARPVLLHLLAPNHRPVQITRDLESFWENVYPKVRGELRRRYPKHSWPDDPRSAVAEARPQRRR
ncbi:MAG: ATP-dependent helicase HrpB [Planctomycetes bacterium]|nr:ATP-dependent helicase HrpB [Planctomycetota bacterium]